MDENDKKLRREIHAAIAFHALLLRHNVLPFGGETYDVKARAEILSDTAKMATEAADALIAELGDLP